MNGALLGGSFLSPSEFQRFLTSQFRKVRMSLLEFCWKPRFKTLKLCQSFFSRHVRPRTSYQETPKLSWFYWRLRTNFLCEKTFIILFGFELSQCRSGKVFSRTSPVEPVVLFLAGLTAYNKIPTPTRCKKFCHKVTERSMVVNFVVIYWQFLQVEWFYRAVQRATKVQVA